MVTKRDVLDATEARKYEDFILDAWSSRREYLSEYHTRTRKLDAFIMGDWAVEFPDGRIIRDKPKIENKILSKIEDTGSLAGSQMPTIRVEALDQRDYTNAERRERVFQFFWQNSELELLLPRLFMDMLGTGLCAMLVWPNFKMMGDKRFPEYKRLDPRHILPPLDYVITGDTAPRDVISHKMVKTRTLANMYPQKAAALLATAAKIGSPNGRSRKNQSPVVDTSQILVVEYFGEDAIVRLGMVDGYPDTAVVLENEVNKTGCCPVVLGIRPTADGRIRGKVEAIMPALSAQNRLMTYVLDYSDQAVYAPLTKKGTVVNAEDFGPNAIIDLGPDGEISRLAPAQISPFVAKIIEDLEEHARQGGNLPQARAGNVGQSQGSAAFVEALMGGLTTEVQTLQMVVQNMLRRANVIAAEQDKAWCDCEKTIAGLARGGSFREKYTPSALFKDTANFVTYGAGSGLDKFNAEIRLSMREKSGYVSKRWVREQLEGIENVTAIENQIVDEAALTATVQFVLTAAASGDAAPLQKLLEVRKRKENVFEALGEIAGAGSLMATGQPQTQMPTVGGGTTIDVATQARAMQKGGLPGNASKVPAPQGQIPGGLPPLNELTL